MIDHRPIVECIDVKFTSKEGVVAPSYQSIGAAGCDLASNDDDVTLQPGERRLIMTGLSVQIPVGFEGQVRPRSGLALKHGITVLNSPGTIDNDYRGEIGVILHNAGQAPFTVKKGERIAQLVFSRAFQATFWKHEKLSQTGRGGGGFGSTGV